MRNVKDEDIAAAKTSALSLDAAKKLKQDLAVAPVDEVPSNAGG